MRRSPAPLAAALLFALLASQPADASPEALRAYQTANGLLAKGHHDLAIPEYESFLTALPDHEQADTARYGLAVCLHRTGEYAKALETLEEIEGGPGFRFASESALLTADCALRLGEPEDAARAVRSALGNARGSTAARMRAILVEAHHRAGEHQRAVDAARDALRADPDNRRIRALAGRSSVALGDNAAAIRYLEPLAESDEQDALACTAMLTCAQAHHRAGNTDTALNYYNTLLTKPFPELLAPAMLGAAQLSREAGDTDRAAALLERLVGFELDTPTEHAARYELGLARFAQQRYADAIAEFERVGEGALEHNATFWTAKAALRSGDAQRAEAALSGAIRDNPEGEYANEMRYERAVALARSGRHDEAAAAFEVFLADNPRHALAPDALHALAAHQLRNGEYADAVETGNAFDRLTNNHPRRADVAFLRAEALHLEGNTHAALRATDAFLRTYPDHPRAADARFRRGLALHETGRSRDAQEDLRAAADSGNPKHAPAILALAQIAEADERWGAAAERYASYAELTSDPAARHDSTLRAALARLRAGETDAAVASFTALDRDTTVAQAVRDRALFELGQAHLTQNEDEAAQRAFQRLVARTPGGDLAPHAYRHLGDLAMRTGESDKAAQFFNSAGTDGDDAPNLALRRARAALASGDANTAKGLAEGIINSPADTETDRRARAVLVLALARLGEHDRVLTELRRIDNPNALDEAERRALELAGANALRINGDTRNAKRVYRNLVNEHTSDAVGAHAAVELAALLIDDGEEDEASDLLAAIDDASAPAINARAAYLRAAAAHRAGDMNAVADLLEGFATNHPGDALVPRAALLQGDALLALGRAAQAARALAPALDESVTASVRAPALLRAGEAHAASQNWPASLAAYDAHRAAFPDDPLKFDAHFGRARASEHLGEYDLAIERYRAVADGHTGELAAHALFQIGECLFAQNKHEEAVREFLRIGILFDAPEWASAGLYEAGRCFEMLNRAGEARAQYREVIERFPDTAWAVPAQERLDALASRSRLPGRSTSNN